MQSDQQSQIIFEGQVASSKQQHMQQQQQSNGDKDFQNNDEQIPLKKKLKKSSRHQSSVIIPMLKWLGFGLVAILIMQIINLIQGKLRAFILILYYQMPQIMTKTQAIFKWIQENPIQGCIVYLLIVFITGVLMFPIFIISIAGTISFKIAFGRFISFMITLLLGSIGYYVACLVSFIISRLFCYKCSRKQQIHLCQTIYRWLNKYDIFLALDGGFQQRGIYLSFLLRASFIVPYNVLNVVMGVTKISFKDYAIGTTAIATHIFFNALIGISISDLTNLFHGNYKDNEFYFWSMIIGTVISIVVCILVVMILNKQLNQIVQKRKLKMRQDRRKQIN